MLSKAFDKSLEAIVTVSLLSRLLQSSVSLNRGVSHCNLVCMQR